MTTDLSELLQEIPPTDCLAFRRDPIDCETLETARSIIMDIRRRGDVAIRDYATQFGDWDGSSPLYIHRSSLPAYATAIDQSQWQLLNRVAQRIRNFALAQRECVRDLDIRIPGGRAGHRVVPVASAGSYAPGGRYPLPSSVLMTVIPARIAGVDNVILASPNPSPFTLAAAMIAGVDGVLTIGGIQAIAAMAYGFDRVSACDVIVGPGNRWVSAAKQVIAGRTRIDMIAGPSEIVILADGTANPGYIALDLLAQAEHDSDALPILITTSRDLLSAVRQEIIVLLRERPTPAARSSLQRGFCSAVGDLKQGCALCNALAPEHLQVMVKDATEIIDELRNYGGLFLGERSAEVFGDYGAGPNHVLPTSGQATRYSGLSVMNFLKQPTWISLDDSGELSELVSDAAAMAELEGLQWHARAAQARLRGEH